MTSIGGRLIGVVLHAISAPGSRSCRRRRPSVTVMPLLPAAPSPPRDPAQRERRDVFRRTLIAYDGSPGLRVALKRSIELAKVLGSELVSISVEEHPPLYATSISEVKVTKEPIDEHFRSLTTQARDLAASSGWRGRHSSSRGTTSGGSWPRPRNSTCSSLATTDTVASSSAPWGARSRASAAPCPILVAK